MKPTTEERFWAKVEKTDGCWLWTGSTGRGYGTFWAGGVVVGAHRYSVALHYGEFDPSLYVLHRCDIPRCVRPDHLYLGDHAQNMKDREERGRNGHANKTHCKHGHEFTEENTYRRKNERSCRTCNRVVSLAAYHRRMKRRGA